MRKIEGKRTRRLAWLAPLLLAVACGGETVDGYQGPVSQEAYTQVMTELMLLDARPLKGASPEEREARMDSARLAIVSRHNVTGEEILEFARVNGSEAGYMELVWQEITHRFDSARVANLTRETEARSEPEGKLGAGAGLGAVESAPSTSSRTPPPVSARGREAMDRLRRGEVARPASADTASDLP